MFNTGVHTMRPEPRVSHVVIGSFYHPYRSITLSSSPRFHFEFVHVAACQILAAQRRKPETAFTSLLCYRTSQDTGR